MMSSATMPLKLDMTPRPETELIVHLICVSGASTSKKEMPSICFQPSFALVS